MPAQSCPVCRVTLDEGATHCPRCSLRIAPLPRRRPGREGAAGDAATAARRDAAWVLRRGLAGAAALLALSLLAGIVAGAPHGDFLTVVDNTAAILGLGALAAAFLVGRRIRILRWWSPPEALRDARGGPVDGPTRLVLVVAGLPPALLSMALLPLLSG